MPYRRPVGRSAVAVLWMILCVNCLPAQDQSGKYKPLKLESADILSHKNVRGRSIMQAFGNVHFTQDTIAAFCDQASFLRDVQVAIMLGNVRFSDGHRTILCKKARYYAKLKKAVCEDQVIFRDGSTTIASDSLVYFQNTEEMTARGNVVAFDSVESVTTYSPFIYYRVQNKYLKSWDRPNLIQYDSTYYKGQNIALLSRNYPSEPITDSLGNKMKFLPSQQITVRANLAEAYLDSNKIILTDSIDFRQDQLVARAHAGYYLTSDELLFMTRSPRTEYAESSLEGDSIVVQFREFDVQTIEVHGSAVGSSVFDLTESKFNSLKAKFIKLIASEDHISQMIAIGNAHNIYFLENKEGANEMTGPTIKLFFNKDNTLRSFQVEGGTEGVYYPEKLRSKLGE